MRISDWSSDVCSSDLAPGTVGIVSATIKGVAGTFRIPFAGGGARSGGRGPTVGDLGPAAQHDAAPLTRRLVSRIPLHIGFAGDDDRLCRSDERRVGEEGVSKGRSGW